MVDLLENGKGEHNKGFNMSLDSDVINSGYTDYKNKASQFTTMFPDPINLPGNWQVGISEIIFPTTIRNITGDNCNIRIDIKKSAGHGFAELKIPEGNYNAKTFVQNLNDIIRSSQSAIEVDDEDDVKFERMRTRFFFNTHSNKIGATLYKNERITMSKDVAYRLGIDVEDEVKNDIGGEVVTWLDRLNLDRSLPVSKMIKVFPFQPNFEAGFETMYVYTDIIDWTYVGNKKMPCIKIVHLAESMNNPKNVKSVSYKYNPVEFFDVSRKSILELTVKLCDGMGQPIRFYGGKTVVKLRFEPY